MKWRRRAVEGAAIITIGQPKMEKKIRSNAAMQF